MTLGYDFSIEQCYTARHRECSNCGDMIYRRISFNTPIGELCPDCFRGYIEDLTKGETASIMDYLETDNADDVTDFILDTSLEDIADVLGYEVYYGE